jgi:hypothetical protein
MLRQGLLLLMDRTYMGRDRAGYRRLRLVSGMLRYDRTGGLRHIGQIDSNGVNILLNFSLGF